MRRPQNAHQSMPATATITERKLEHGCLLNSLGTKALAYAKENIGMHLLLHSFVHSTNFFRDLLCVLHDVHALLPHLRYEEDAEQ